MTQKTTPADASIALDGYKVLDPSCPDFGDYYVPRPTTDRVMIREAITAHCNDRPFLWFFTGHTGAGKSTELNRIRRDPDITSRYLPLYVNIERDFDLPNVVYTDLVLAMARACESAALELKCPVPKELKERIASWGKEIVREEEAGTATEGTAGLSVNTLIFGKLGEEVKTGGRKREIIRERMYADITAFIHLLDDLTDALSSHTGRKPLCILDGMDHADPTPCRRALREFYSTITKPRLSKLFVIPLYLLMEPDFAPNIAGFHSTLPNVKVFEGPGSPNIHDGGFRFYKDVISRYAALELFEPEALESLFKLSAGILRDMIRFTGDACGYAADAGADRVALVHAQKVWHGEMARLHLLVSRADVEILEEVERHPRPRGADGLSYLLHRKAVICYPNHVDWYGVHPALRAYFQFDGPRASGPHGAPGSSGSPGSSASPGSPGSPGSSASPAAPGSSNSPGSPGSP